MNNNITLDGLINSADAMDNAVDDLTKYIENAVTYKTCKMKLINHIA